MGTRAVVWALGFALACGGGSGGDGGGPEPPPPPTGLTLTQGPEFDRVFLGWTPPPTPVDGYAVEDRIGSEPFAPEPGLLPGDAIGADVTLLSSVPELVQLGCRMRSVKGRLYSSYTPEATLFRGLRPPAGLAVHTLTEDVQLAWSRGSLVAAELLLERATWSDAQGAFGPYAALATLSGGATGYLDRPTDGPLVSYGYRLRYTTPFNGAAVQSTAIEQAADQRTSLAPPASLSAAATAEGVRLEWTVASRNLLGQAVERAAGFGAGDGAFAGIAFLGPAAASYTDPVPPGPYTYRVRSTTSPTGYGYGPSLPSEASLLVPPPAGSWSLQARTLALPLGDGLARTAEGAWHVAANWCSGPVNPMGLALWRPAGSAWDMRACGPVLGESRFVSPGVALDAAGHPHALYLRDTDPATEPGPFDITHLWHDGTQWQEETLATRVLRNGNVRYPAEFAMDPSGKLHVLWKAEQVVGQVSTPVLEYATNASGSWTVGPLPVSLVADLANILGFRLAAAPDGTIHAALAANTSGTQGPRAGSLLLLRKPAAGPWLEELAFADTLYLWAEVPFVILPRDADRAGFLFCRETTYPDPNRYYFASRSAAGWGAAQPLAEEATGSGYKVPAAAARADGSRIAALLPAPAGTTLMTWDAAQGWASTVLRPPDPFGIPWLAFDAQGVLHVLVPGGSAGADGLAPWIHIVSTR